MSKASGGDAKNTLYCSFCGKSQHEVRKLIAGPTVFICDECVELCNDIIREESKSALVKTRDGETLAFAALVNNFEGPGASANQALDSIAVLLASFSRQQ